MCLSIKYYKSLDLTDANLNESLINPHTLPAENDDILSLYPLSYHIMLFEYEITPRQMLGQENCKHINLSKRDRKATL